MEDANEHSPASLQYLRQMHFLYIKKKMTVVMKSRSLVLY
jgi:hypothetical protein